MASPSRDRRLSLADNGKVVAYLSPMGGGEEQPHVLTFHEYFFLLRRNWWKIAIAVVVCTGLTALLCSRITPVYEATARITIDQKMPSSVIGQEAVQSGGSDVDQLMNTEIQIIQSDAVLRPVAEEFHLLPGGKNGSPASNDAPVVLDKLSVARIPNSLLIDVSYRSTDPRLAARIANAMVHSYITRGMEMRARSSMGVSAFMEKQIAELKQNMDNSAQALAGYERQLGVIDPDEKTSILAARLLQLNTQYTDAENERIRRETAYQALRSGSSAALEVSPEAATLGALDERVRAAQEKMALAKTVYGPTYAEYKRAANELAEVTRQNDQMRGQIGQRIEVEYQEAKRREAMLHASLLQTKDESDKLNASSFQYQQLKREAEANKTLYNELFRKIKEAGINAGFQSSSIRIADEARPPLSPIMPRKKVFVFLAFMISLLGSTAVVLVAEMLDKSLRDPRRARIVTGLEIVGSLPDVRRFPEHYLAQAALEEASPSRNSDWFRTLEFYRECIATMLSSTLHDKSARVLGSILITSAGPGEGKSSCAAHIAAAHAAQGKRTLLIDADLRRPSQHGHFGLENDRGLADMIQDAVPFHAVRKRVATIDNLDVIVAGSPLKRGTVLVGQKIAELISQVGKEYDLILIDAPPMLCLAEPIQIACIADGVLLISHAGRTSQQAVLDALSALDRVHANILGLVLNRVRLNMSQDYDRFRAYNRYSARLTAKAS
ncbi:MAG TPA: polysaccharide biosynthesis tyrosine autokinase [Acidobacteriaceae bacterium]